MSTQDRAVRGGDVASQEGEHEGEAAAGVSGGLSEPMRLRAMQRRWVQRKAGGAGGAGAGAGGAAAIPGGGGAPLGGGVRSRMENTLGADLSGVRVHTGGDSAEAAEALGARAFTVGSDVHFNRGEFAPGSKEGDRLLAHELTHVVQGQKSGVQRKADAAHDSDGGHGDHEAAGHEVSEPGDAAEKEADAMGDHAANKLHGADGEHGAAGGEHAQAAPAGASGTSPSVSAPPSKKVSRKPRISAAAPGVGRKIFRADKPGAPSDKKKDPKAAAAPTSSSAPTAGPKAGAPTDAATKPDPKLVAAERQAVDLTARLTGEPSAALLAQLEVSDGAVKRLTESCPDSAKVKELQKLFTDKLEASKAKGVALMTETAQKMKALPTAAASYDQLKGLRANPELFSYRMSRYLRDLPEAKAVEDAFAVKEKEVVDAHYKACKDAEAMITSAPLDDTGLVQIDHAVNAVQVYWEGKLSGHLGAASKEKAVHAAADAQRAKINADIKKKQEEQQQQQQQKAQQTAAAGKGPTAAAGTGAAAAAASASAPSPAPAPNAATPAKTATSSSTPAAGGAAQNAPAALKPPAPPQPAPAPAPAPAPSTPAPHAPAVAAADAHAAPAAASSSTDHAPTSAAAPPAAAPPAAAHAGGEHGGEHGGGPAGPGAGGDQDKKPKSAHELAIEQAEAEVEVLVQNFIAKMAQWNVKASGAAAITGVVVHGTWIASVSKTVLMLLTKLKLEEMKATSIELIKQMDSETVGQLLLEFAPGREADGVLKFSDRIESLYRKAERAKAEAAGKSEHEIMDAGFDKVEKAKHHGEEEGADTVVNDVSKPGGERSELFTEIFEVLEKTGAIPLHELLGSFAESLGEFVPVIGYFFARKAARQEAEKLAVAKKKLEDAKKELLEAKGAAPAAGASAAAPPH